jgi:hypothetical protein
MEEYSMSVDQLGIRLINSFAFNIQKNITNKLEINPHE